MNLWINFQFDVPVMYDDRRFCNVTSAFLNLPGSTERVRCLVDTSTKRVAAGEINKSLGDKGESKVERFDCFQPGVECVKVR